MTSMTTDSPRVLPVRACGSRSLRWIWTMSLGAAALAVVSVGVLGLAWLLSRMLERA